MALSLQVADSWRDKWLNPSMPPHWARWRSWPTHGQLATFLTMLLLELGKINGQDAIKLCNLIWRNSILTTQNPYNYDLIICEICIEENNKERKEGGKEIQKRVRKEKSFIIRLFLNLCVWKCVQHKGRYYKLILRGCLAKKPLRTKFLSEWHKLTFKHNAFT